MNCYTVDKPWLLGNTNDWPGLTLFTIPCCYAAHMEHCLMLTFPAVSPAHMYLLVPLKIAQPGSGMSTCGKRYERFCLFYKSVSSKICLSVRIGLFHNSINICLSVREIKPIIFV